MVRGEAAATTTGDAGLICDDGVLAALDFVLSCSGPFNLIFSVPGMERGVWGGGLRGNMIFPYGKWGGNPLIFCFWLRDIPNDTFFTFWFFFSREFVHSCSSVCVRWVPILTVRG